MSKKIEINLVDHLDVALVKECISMELTSASVTGQGSYREIEKARGHLEKARGLYAALLILDLVSARYTENMASDMDSVGIRLNRLYSEKEAEAVARCMGRGWL